jgi:hypothetical protein
MRTYHPYFNIIEHKMLLSGYKIDSRDGIIIDKEPEEPFVEKPKNKSGGLSKWAQAGLYFLLIFAIIFVLAVIFYYSRDAVRNFLGLVN